MNASNNFDQLLCNAVSVTLVAILAPWTADCFAAFFAAPDKPKLTIFNAKNRERADVRFF